MQLTTLVNSNMLNLVQNSLKVFYVLLRGQGPSGDQLTLKPLLKTAHDLLLLLQYVWNENEMFLFRATLAFAMRSHFSSEEYK